MARTAAPGGARIFESGETIDTIDHGIVKILMIGTAASATGTVTVGDTSSGLSACPAEDIVDIDTGEPVTLNGGDGDKIVACYVGYCRYVKVVFANATGIVELDEARDSGPDPE